MESVNAIANSTQNMSQSDSGHGRGRGCGRGNHGNHGRSTNHNQNANQSHSQVRGRGFTIEDCFLNTESNPDGISNSRMATIDSGATATMTGLHTNDLISGMKMLKKPLLIHFPNGQSAITSNAGKLNVKTVAPNGDNMNITFEDVLIAKELKHTVISIACICDKGAIVIFTKKDTKIVQKLQKGKLYEVASFPQNGNLYQMDLRIPQLPEKEFNNSIMIEKMQNGAKMNDITMLHYMLGHIHETAIKQAILNGHIKSKFAMQNALKQTIKKCPICMISKAKQQP